MDNWVSYENGNYTVKINLADGTKIRENDLDNFRADFPESMDIKITNRCTDPLGKGCGNCTFCHENSGPCGKHGDIMNLEFIEKLHPYTELAIGGGNPLEHPDFEAFLIKCKNLKLIPSITIHQNHFLDNIDFIRHLVNEKLIYGLGISLTAVTPQLIGALKEFPNAVIHMIAGIASPWQFVELSKLNFKILILGYKQFRRGEALYNTDAKSIIDERIEELKSLLPVMIKHNWFNVVSFDNLAIKQLNVKNLLSEEQWNEFYMGDDGSATMYVDCVNKEFARSSTSTERYPIKDNIIDMFSVIRS